MSWSSDPAEPTGTPAPGWWNGPPVETPAISTQWQNLSPELNAPLTGTGVLMATVRQREMVTVQLAGNGEAVGSTKQIVPLIVGFDSTDTSQGGVLTNGLSAWSYSLDARPVNFGGEGVLFCNLNDDGLSAYLFEKYGATDGQDSIGTLVAAIKQIYMVAAQFSSEGTLYGEMLSDKDGLSATAYQGYTFNLLLTSIGTLSAALKQAYARSSAFSGSGALAAAARMYLISRGATFNSAGTLSNTTVAQMLRSAALSGAGTLSATAIGVAIVAISGPLSGSGTFNATAYVQYVRALSLAGSGQLSATALMTMIMYPAGSSSTHYADNFNRTNNTDIGPLWLNDATYPYALIGNELQPVGAIGIAFTNGDMTTPDYTVNLTVGTSLGVGEGVLIQLRAEPVAELYNGSAPMINGVVGPSPLSWTSGDVLSYGVNGTTYFLKKNGVSVMPDVVDAVSPPGTTPGANYAGFYTTAGTGVTAIDIEVFSGSGSGSFVSGNGSLTATKTQKYALALPESGVGTLSAVAFARPKVLFDAASDGGSGASSTKSWSHTNNGNAIVVIMTNSTSSASSCTYGGVSIPRVYGPVSGGNFSGFTSYTSIFALVSNSLPTGSNTVSCTQGGSAAATAAVTFKNAGSIGTVIADTASGNVNRASVAAWGAAAAYGTAAGNANFGALTPNQVMRYSFSAFNTWATTFGYGVSDSAITFASTHSGSKAGALVPILPIVYTVEPNPTLLTGVTYTQSSTYSGTTAANYTGMNNLSAAGSPTNQAGTNTGSNQYIRANAGSAKDIESIVIGYDYLTNLPGGFGTTYTDGLIVQGSLNGTTWTNISTVPTYAVSGAVNGLLEIPINGTWQYIQLLRTSGYACCTEFELWEAP